MISKLSPKKLKEHIEKRPVLHKTLHHTKQGSKKVLLHTLQMGYDSLPLDVIDLIRGKTLITGIPLHVNTVRYNARIIDFLVKAGLWYEIIAHGQGIINSAKSSLYELFVEHEVPDGDYRLYLTMTLFSVDKLIYWLLIKPADLARERKQRKTLSAKKK